MEVDTAIEQNMNILHNDIVLCSTARLLEEILKILRKGNALRGFQEMTRYQFCNKLIPQLQHFYAEMHTEYLVLLERCLYAADTLFLEGKKVYDMPLICSLFYPVYLFYLSEAEKRGGNLDRGELASFILYHYAGYLHLTKRMTEKLKQILILLHYFSTKFTGKNRKGKRNDPLRIAGRTFFKESLNFYKILCMAQLGDDRVYRYWKSFYFKVATSNDSLHDDNIEQLTG